MEFAPIYRVFLDIHTYTLKSKKKAQFCLKIVPARSLCVNIDVASTKETKWAIRDQ